MRMKAAEAVVHFSLEVSKLTANLNFRLQHLTRMPPKWTSNDL